MRAAWRPAVQYSENPSQLLGYADDLDLIESNVEVVKENFTRIEEKGAEFGQG